MTLRKKIHVMWALITVHHLSAPGITGGICSCPTNAANAAERSSNGLTLGELTGVHSGVGGHNIVGKSPHSAAKFASVSQSTESVVPVLRHSAKLASVSPAAVNLPKFSSFASKKSNKALPMLSSSGVCLTIV